MMIEIFLSRKKSPLFDPSIFVPLESFLLHSPSKKFSSKTLFKSTSRRKISAVASLFGSTVINGIPLGFSSAPFGTIEHLLFGMGVEFRTFSFFRGGGNDGEEMDQTVV
ncbi:hypothetical protein AVEN_134095-1 [Araneus ventricosus]|uniref:Uncharacterized protein n=1 Tax=Araneus ventricosus TaxID=182803 RepID=A0A4Y2ELY0_ARAVE|nr:hypothetical protein AVEN_134095-1 [Araneus ventricosus]